MNRGEVVKMLIEYDVPVAQVNMVKDIFNCPQVKDREMLTQVNHPIADQ